MSQESVVESIAQELLAKREEKSKIDEEVKAIELRIDELAGQEELENGSITLEGETVDLKVNRRVNVSYSDKDALSELISENSSELGPLFRIELKESGKKVDVFLEKGSQVLVQQLKDIRKRVPGKASVKVEARKATV